jgi:hypothetical protein
MRDFFYELAAKNLGTANVIVPRRSSLFESESLHSQLPTLESQSLTTPKEMNPRQTDRTTPPRTSGVPEQTENSQDDSKAISPDRGETSEKYETNKSGQRNYSASRNFETTHDDSQVSSRSVTQTAGSIVPVVPPTETRLVQQLVHEITVRPQSIVEENARAEENKKDSPPETKIIAKPQILVSQKNGKEASTSRAPINTIPKPLVVDKNSEVSTINISIGRVEIRAIPSATPLRTAPAKPSTLSLDEYLRKRRNGGAR